jgi:hypothetical protein
METLRQRYGGILELPRTMLGVVPNATRYLEIWPIGFHTYNVIVPNLLNLPLSLWGLAAPRDIVGLAMYVASRAAQCAYCSAPQVKKAAKPVTAAVETVAVKELSILAPGITTITEVKEAEAPQAS